MRRTTITTLALAALALPAGVEAQVALEKFSLHGYLTQGAAISDSGLTMGIPEEGTTDYRRAAIMLRYASTQSERFVVQVAHRRLGESPTMAYEDNLKIDWAFYERSFATGTRLRVGRAPIPFGIYNETRYVGTLLPFYRAPYSFYFEGTFTSEAVDGLVATQTFGSDSRFRTEVSAYAGSYDLIEFAQLLDPSTMTFTYTTAESRSSNVLGGQLWMETPVAGLRVGGGGYRWTASGGVLRTGDAKESGRAWNAGIDATFDRVFARAEVRRTGYDDLTYESHYLQVGVNPIGGLWVNAQAEAGAVHTEYSGVGSFDIDDFLRDYALGLGYRFRSDLVLKLEGHVTEGFNYESSANIYTGEPGKGSYVISSLSVAF